MKYFKNTLRSRLISSSSFTFLPLSQAPSAQTPNRLNYFVIRSGSCLLKSLLLSCLKSIFGSINSFIQILLSIDYVPDISTEERDVLTLSICSSEIQRLLTYTVGRNVNQYGDPSRLIMFLLWHAAVTIFYFLPIDCEN